MIDEYQDTNDLQEILINMISDNNVYMVGDIKQSIYRFRNANQAVLKSLSYAYVGRKDKKSDFRKLWITRINAACRMNNISYSKFIDGLNKAGVEINRKMLSELAIQDMNEFNKLVEVAKKALENGKVETETKTESNDLSSKTVAELKALAKEKGIEGYTTMKKADLLNALK